MIRHITTKLRIALELVNRTVQLGIPFEAVVADNFYGEDRTLRRGLRNLKLGYALALKPVSRWWHRIGTDIDHCKKSHTRLAGRVQSNQDNG
jgi:SRSO17 transposase